MLTCFPALPVTRGLKLDPLIPPLFAAVLRSHARDVHFYTLYIVIKNLLAGVFLVGVWMLTIFQNCIPLISTVFLSVFSYHVLPLSIWFILMPTFSYISCICPIKGALWAGKCFERSLGRIISGSPSIHSRLGPQTKARGHGHSSLVHNF